MIDFTKLQNEYRAKADDLDTYREIISKIEDLKNWNYADYHEPDDEHEGAWFSKPEPAEEGDYYNERRLRAYELCARVIEAIEKMATK